MSELSFRSSNSNRTLLYLVAILGLLIWLLFRIGTGIAQSNNLTKQQLAETSGKRHIITQQELNRESLPHIRSQLDAMVKAAFRDEVVSHTFIDKQTRRIYLNLSAIHEDPTLYSLDQLWHSLVVTLLDRETKTSFRYPMSPCPYHPSSKQDPQADIHAIFLDTNFELSEDEWARRYAGFTTLILQSGNNAKKLYYCQVLPERYDRGHSRRPIRFDRAEEIDDVRLVLRLPFNQPLPQPN